MAGAPRAPRQGGGGDGERVTLKNLWYLAKQAYERHPERLNLINDFFFDAPLNGTFAHRNLRLLEPMDQAREPRGTEYRRPEIYRFIEALYGRAPPRRKDTAANSRVAADEERLRLLPPRPGGGGGRARARPPRQLKRNAAAQNAAPKLNAQKTRKSEMNRRLNDTVGELAEADPPPRIAGGLGAAAAAPSALGVGAAGGEAYLPGRRISTAICRSARARARGSSVATPPARAITCGSTIRQ